MDDTKVCSGHREGYDWVTIRSRRNLLGSFIRVVPDAVLGHVVAITSFDSGPLLPSDEEKARGWFCQGKVLWTSRIEDAQWLPWDQYDEWYVFDHHIQLSSIEPFVNYGGFSLEDPRPLFEANPTWDRSSCEFELALKEKFWAQLTAVLPITYIAEGDCFNLATKDAALFNKIIEWSRLLFRP